jgi:transcriptional regulator with XRE-family HTH domain
MARKGYRDGYVGAHISNTIASQITKLRIENGWTQKQLAQRTGMKQSRISALEDPNWENVEVATLERLASAFDVGLTVRFIAFSDLARWAATLSDDKLIVSRYEQEKFGDEYTSVLADQNPVSAIQLATASVTAAGGAVVGIEKASQPQMVPSELFGVASAISNVPIARIPSSTNRIATEVLSHGR